MRTSDSGVSRDDWRRDWLCSIEEFADLQAQRRLWLGPENRNPHYSFIEYMCSYFDDLNLSEAGYSWALAKGYVSEDELAAVAAFHVLADEYESPWDDYDDAAILADPNWAEVVLAAEQAKHLLIKLISDPSERRWLSPR